MKDDDELKGVHSWGCSAHYMNLLENDISVSAVIKHATAVNKFFKSNDKPHVSKKKLVTGNKEKKFFKKGI